MNSSNYFTLFTHFIEYITQTKIHQLKRTGTNTSILHNKVTYIKERFRLYIYLFILGTT